MPTDTLLDKPTGQPTQLLAELTIQEMARQSGLSEHTLRYYERIGLLTPIPRDGSSGHRRFPPETVQLVESLACLRGTGMTVADMRHYLQLNERGDTDRAQAIAGENRLMVKALVKMTSKEE